MGNSCSHSKIQKQSFKVLSKNNDFNITEIARLSEASELNKEVRPGGIIPDEKVPVPLSRRNSRELVDTMEQINE